MFNQFIEAVWSVVPRETEFWAAVAGAVIGGLISVILQGRANRAAKLQRDEDRQRVQHAQAFGLLFKLIRLHANIYNIHQHFEEAFSAGHPGEPWQFVLPIVNLPDPVHFSPDEMGMLLGLKDDNAFNATAELDGLHNALLDGMRALVRFRRELGSRMKPTGYSGNRLEGVFTEAQLMELRPAMIELNTLIEGLRAGAARDEKQSRSALKQVHAVFRKELGISPNIEFKDEAALQAEAKSKQPSIFSKAAPPKG